LTKDGFYYKFGVLKKILLTVGNWRRAKNKGRLIMEMLTIPFLVVIGVVIFILANSIRVLNEYERGVIFRLGRAIGAKGPGLIILIPIIDKMVKVDLRTVTMDVPPQEVITRDNVSVKVNAVVYFRALDPMKAVLSVENYLYATSQLAQTTLRSVCGQGEMDDLLSEREKINRQLQEILDRQTDPWGVKVSTVEIKGIDLPDEMKRAMAKQAEAEREKRAKIIHSAGEYEAAANLAKAADMISINPVTLQLRYLQTLTEIAVEKNSTILFPLPMDMLKPFLNLGEKK
jgi:regulator of protease activity HflC (stomatin/prohibitin superfamily)